LLLRQHVAAWRQKNRWRLSRAQIAIVDELGALLFERYDRERDLPAHRSLEELPSLHAPEPLLAVFRWPETVCRPFWRKAQHCIRSGEEQPVEEIVGADVVPVTLGGLRPGKKQRSACVLGEPLEHHAPLLREVVPCRVARLTPVGPLLIAPWVPRRQYCGAPRGWRASAGRTVGRAAIIGVAGQRRVLQARPGVNVAHGRREP
jgi:hypothetical protein